MRLIRNVVLICMLLFIGFYFLERTNYFPENALDSFSDLLAVKKSALEMKDSPEESQRFLEGDLFQWIGKSSSDLTKTLGDPIRKDLSAYGYEWWVYTDGKEQYIQYGVENNEIKTIYALGDGLSIEPVQIGQSYESVNDQLSFKKEVTYNEGIAAFTFRLNEDDINIRPIVKTGEKTYTQYYFDTLDDKLTSVRILSADILLKHRPYEIEYRGDLPDPPDLSDDEWKKVDDDMEQEIFDMTNVIRNQFGQSELKWNNALNEVAFLHSKDMAENNYFSHYGLDGSGLKERLAAKEVSYVAAGENIAAQYPDAAAVMMGWLNSEGHRKALLSESYTHLGAGVYQFYYTQNFIAKPF